VCADAAVLARVVTVDAALCVLVGFFAAAGVGFGAGFLVGDTFSVAVVGFGVCVGSVFPVVPDVTVFVVVLFTCSDATGVAAGPVEVCVLVVVDPLVAEVSDVGEFEDVGEFDDLAVSSAEATPYPVAIAVPTPSATASPPTRPMWAAAPMLFLHEASSPSITDRRN
jgi:hypothetical protein